MDWSRISLYTPMTEFPKFWNNNFSSVKRYLDTFYDGSLGKILVPLETTGKVKGTLGEFVTAQIDNLVVRNQYTNLYDNYTTVDSEFYNTYIEGVATLRDASVFENEEFSYIDVNEPYYKIYNDASVAFSSDNLGQEFQVLFDISTGNPFNILLDPSYGGSFRTLSVSLSDAEKTWIKFLAVDYDASWGTTWTIKQYGGDYTIS